MRKLFLILALLAADSRADTWEQLIGTWQGEGTLYGQPVVAWMEWQPALADRFVRLIYIVRTPEGQPMFSGEALYRRDANPKSEGIWADTAGHLHPIRFQIGDRAIQSEWGTAETERGRSIYRVADNGRLEVIDRVWREQDWREFARIGYRRIDRGG